MTAFGVRALTAEEADLARETFGGAVRLAHVRILALQVNRERPTSYIICHHQP